MRTHRSEDAWNGLLSLVRTLRGPSGCPWDRDQTTESLAPYLVEEAYEVLHAVEDGKDESVLEEAGDLAFVLSLFLVTAEEEGRGRIRNSLEATVAKIRERHPHVFDSGGDSVSTAPAESTAQSMPPRPDAPPGSTPRTPGAPLMPKPIDPELSRTLQLEWERSKRVESTGRTGSDAERAAVGNVDADRGLGPHRLPLPHPALPSLAQAAKLQNKAANLGFDWPDVRPVFAKVREELGELEDAHASQGPAEVREELGDLLFAVVNLARSLGVEPESALRRGNEKFRTRFHAMLALMEAEGLDPVQSDLETMDQHWEAAKTAARLESPDRESPDREAPDSEAPDSEAPDSEAP